MRFVISAIMGLAMAWAVWSRSKSEVDSSLDESSPKYQPYIAGYVLPFFLVGLHLLGLIVMGTESTTHLILSMCFSVFLTMSFYYAILLALLPLLRRRISARACAMLWIIPNYLYVLERDFLVRPAPLLVITAPGKLVWVLIGIWFVGFMGVLLWKFAAHIRFRGQLLNGAEDCPIQIRQQWKLALAQARYKNKDIPLLVSPNVTTPVTVGLFRWSTVVVLPRKTYTPEELDLIFHHEIVHIGRQDAWNKFFFVFCTAMCWFNPLMWLAMAKSAEDMELSCDETVLLDADETTRKRYASLLLNTAGDGRGFTTCLSASAEALRYRLRNIVKPMKRATGATVVGIAFCILAVSGGYVALAYDETPASEIFVQPDETSTYELTVVDQNGGTSQEDLPDAEGILEYLSGLHLYRIVGHYDFSNSQRFAYFKLFLPGVATYRFYVYDNSIEVLDLHGKAPRLVMYYIPDGIDWEHLDSLIPAA